ncbi:MAG: hypothetical protein AB1689_28045, partial [Thermodesulfobacteriota bacterium]
GAAVPPPEDSVEGAVAAIGVAVQVAGAMPSGSAGRGPAERTRAACAPRAEGGCPGIDVAACSPALVALFDALAADARASDAATRDLAALARIVVSGALSRLAWLRHAAADGCPLARPAGEVAALVTLGPDGTTLRVRPLRPLRQGRSYRLTLDGVPDTSPIAWSPGAGAPEAEIGRRLAGRYDAVFAGQELAFRDAGARELLRRLATQAADVPAPPSTGAVEALPQRPLTGAELLSVRARFLPVRRRGAGASAAGGERAAGEAGLEVRVLDARAGLAGYRDALAREACGPVERDGLGVEPTSVGFTGAAVAGVFRGRYPSLDVGGGRGSARILGVRAADARPVERPFLLALPRGFGPETPLVVAVHGHGGRAEAMVKAHAIGLARRGVATLAIDLAGHGERSGEGDFVDPLDPGRLTLGMRQAAVDVLAAVRAASCGYVLPGGRTWRPAEVRYLGYSMGAMVGVLVRSVEPRLGTTVLAAPAADFAEWQVLQVPKELGAEHYQTCSGGPAHGRPCATAQQCAPDGVCFADAQLLLLRDLVTPAYGLVHGPAEPAGFAAERTGGASTAPLLLVGGGLDLGLGPHAAARLAEAYGLRPDESGARRGSARFVAWPQLGHDLLASPAVRDQVHDFLASRGRRVNPVPGAAG